MFHYLGVLVVLIWHCSVALMQQGANLIGEPQACASHILPTLLFQFPEDKYRLRHNIKILFDTFEHKISDNIPSLFAKREAAWSCSSPLPAGSRTKLAPFRFYPLALFSSPKYFVKFCADNLCPGPDQVDVIWKRETREIWFKLKDMQTDMRIFFWKEF